MSWIIFPVLSAFVYTSEIFSSLTSGTEVVSRKATGSGQGMGSVKVSSTSSSTSTGFTGVFRIY